MAFRLSSIRFTSLAGSAYVVTRPLGASIAHWLAKPVARTGLGVGDGTVSAIALAAFVGLVAYLAVTRRDIQHPESEEAVAGPVARGVLHGERGVRQPLPTDG